MRERLNTQWLVEVLTEQRNCSANMGGMALLDRQVPEPAPLFFLEKPIQISRVISG
ncbi:hypothetical protein KDH_27720 [Dictyobacter sp. S3.2.2.5]|uniref:Uncharacterized protein n=1 Tax=Dictyobacter halimunensis TaxID=3026934 RepID=A0ABQ6FQR2_9CHLR|nr:hypothetical protein KDH_27720 [Dictyobacter sp. S3.2.2.5]